MAKNELRLSGSTDDARLSLNGVDLSYRNVTSAPLGMLIPTMVQEVVGGSKIRIGLENQTRCRPLVVPAFARVREHFDYFFVPFSQLWHQFDNFKSMQGNYNSTLVDDFMNSELPSRIPAFGSMELFYAIQGAETSTLTDVAGFPLSYGMMRLADNLGYGVLFGHSGLDQDIPNVASPRLNAFRALAYQKIYFDYYRNDKYEGNYPNHYNIDDIKYSDSQSDRPFSYERLQKIFEPHYRWRKLDYFTSVWPNDIPNNKLFGFEGFRTYMDFGAGVGSDFNMQGIAVLQGTTPLKGSRIQIDRGIGNTADIEGSHEVTGTSGDIGAAVAKVDGIANTAVYQSASIHKLLAAQERYLRRLYAAKQNFPSIMKAIFGYSPKVGRNGSVMHLGGCCNRIQIADVNNTASFEDMGFNGKINEYSSNNKIVDGFEVPEDGIIMCIYSTSVENDYRSNQCNRHNCKSFPEEYFNPSYAHLGRQPLFGFEYRCPITSGGSGDPIPLEKMTRVLGYVERYLEYKTHVDEVHGAFATDSFKPYSVFMNNDLDFDKPLSLTSLIINPNIMRDLIAGGVFDGSAESDHFYLNIYNKVDCLTPVPVGDVY